MSGWHILVHFDKVLFLNIKLSPSSGWPLCEEDSL